MISHVSLCRVLVTSGMLALSLFALAQEEEKINNLTIDLQLLSRGEIRNGGMTTDEDDPSSDDKSAFVIDRERFVVGYKRDWLETKATIQHSGVWGQEGTGTVGIYETWAKMSAKNGLFAQLGRLVLNYDDERVIGPDNWSVTSLTHDALRLGYEGHGHKVHAILAYNQNAKALKEPGSYYENGSNPYKTMHTIWYHYDIPKIPFGASLLFMNIGMQGGEKHNNPHTEYQQLTGGYLNYHPNHWQVEGSYYRQMGKDENGMEIDAWMASFKTQWRPNDTYSLFVGYDYLSGDDYFAVPGEHQTGLTLHDKIKGFSPVYGSHHKFYGAMDFFYLRTYVNGFSPGFQNIYGGGSINIGKRLNLSATYHYLAITTNLKRIDKTLGHEIELEAGYKMAKDISLNAGFSYMTGTKTMERLKRASDDGSLRWAWISLNVRPRIFSTKW